MDNVLRHLKFALIPRGPILDIGSGGAPFWRSNVLMDRYVDNDIQRPAALIVDRSMVCGDIHAIPFQNKSFNFVHCSHVLEHVQDPAKAIGEMMRIAKAGYIETPSAFQELAILNFPFHRWFVTRKNNVLIFREKSENLRPEYAMLTELLIESLTEEHTKRSPFERILFIKHFWEEYVQFQVERSLNAIRPFDMESNVEIKDAAEAATPTLEYRLKRKLEYALRAAYKVDFNYLEFLACPICKSAVKIKKEVVEC
ncbi:MAG: class I SAM-dependent methyltransferase, partial [Gammaproteobacteria bacterium]